MGSKAPLLHLHPTLRCWVEPLPTWETVNTAPWSDVEIEFPCLLPILSLCFLSHKVETGEGTSWALWASWSIAQHLHMWRLEAIHLLHAPGTEKWTLFQRCTHLCFYQAGSLEVLLASHTHSESSIQPSVSGSSFIEMSQGSWTSQQVAGSWTDWGQ